MGRKKKGTPVHGWVVIDKPQGVTSTQVVAIVKRVFDAQKAGHAGTLDPMATGVLAVALGEATKTVAFAMDSEKTYRFTACWGEARDSDDAEGAVTATSAKRPSREEIEQAIPSFTGMIEQTPPSYSAIKVEGERAYDLARDGEAVSLESRMVLIKSVSLLETPDAGPCRVRNPLWQRDLRPRLGARSGLGAGHGRACFAASPHPGRRLFGRFRNWAGNPQGFYA